MTPKEKAKELVERMFNVDLQCDNEAMCMLYPHAIKCALIAVEEILKQFNKIKVSHIISGYATYKDFEKNLTSIQDQLDSEMIWKWNYWNEVKQEIKKL